MQDQQLMAADPVQESPSSQFSNHLCCIMSLSNILQPIHWWNVCFLEWHSSLTLLAEPDLQRFLGPPDCDCILLASFFDVMSFSRLFCFMIFLYPWFFAPVHVLFQIHGNLKTFETQSLPTSLPKRSWSSAIDSKASGKLMLDMKHSA